MRILVTGARGFIGRAVVRRLLAGGEQVRAMYRGTSPQCRGEALPHHLEMVCADLTDAPTVERAVDGCDAVIHLAALARNWAPDPLEYDRVNVEGTRRILDAAVLCGIRRVLCVSSVMTLGPTNGTIADETIERSNSPWTDYERTKLIVEDVVRRYAGMGLEVPIVNPTRVFGPGPLSEGNAVTIMIREYLEGRWHMVLGNGNVIGNYAFVEDVARGIVAALKCGRSGERYVLGGTNLTYRELFKAVDQAAGCHHVLLPVPPPIAYTIGYLELTRAKVFSGYPQITPGWIRTFLHNAAYTSAKAEQELGYRVTPLEEAIGATTSWLLELKEGKESLS